MSEKSKICIECCNKVENLCKIYKDGFIDINQCDKCNEIVDKYLECEYSVILIDLILFKPTAYRHIIINKQIRNALLLKFLLLFLLCDAYLEWFHVKNRQFESIQSNDHQLFYELEWSFYFMLINSIIDYGIYALLLAVGIRLLRDKQYFKRNAYVIFKSLIVSSFGKLMVIPLIIWNPNTIYFSLANLFTYMSNYQALKVSTNLSNKTIIFIILLSNGFRLIMNKVLDN